MVSDAMLSFDDCFQVVDDPRVVPRCTHSLHAILFVAVASTIAGADGPEDMAKFAKRKASWLKQFVDLEEGVPLSRYPGTRTRGDPTQAHLVRRSGQDAFLDWISSLPGLQDQDGKPIFMPIDGKTMRGSYTKADKSDMLHIVSAWASIQGITRVLWQL